VKTPGPADRFGVNPGCDCSWIPEQSRQTRRGLHKNPVSEAGPALTAYLRSRELRLVFLIHRALREEGALKRYLCVCLASRRREVEDLTILPYREFLDGLWCGEYQIS